MRKTVFPFWLWILFLAIGTGASAQNWSVDVYTGVQGATDSDVSGTDENGTPFDFTAGWEGRSFEMPPYWGLRAMRDTAGPWSFGLEFTHAKVQADDDTLDDSGFNMLELTDGLNVLTANAEREIDLTGRWSAHAGLGLGIAVPYVEVVTPGGTETTGYQLTGPAARWYLGARYALTGNVSAFAEYNGTYSSNTADLDGGGDLETEILTNALNVGIGFSF
ncbi:MAG: lipid A oxidase [Pseudomonadota bacterium]